MDQWCEDTANHYEFKTIYSSQVDNTFINYYCYDVANLLSDVLSAFLLVLTKTQVSKVILYKIFSLVNILNISWLEVYSQNPQLDPNAA